jgi:hypothetical protein
MEFSFFFFAALWEVRHVVRLIATNVSEEPAVSETSTPLIQLDSVTTGRHSEGKTSLV